MHSIIGWVHIHISCCHWYLGREEKYSAYEKNPGYGYDVDWFPQPAQGEWSFDEVHLGFVELMGENNGYIREVEGWCRNTKNCCCGFYRPNCDAVQTDA